MSDDIKRALTNEDRIELTDELIELLNERNDADPEWQKMLDVAFFSALFDHDVKQPYFAGPDGFRYFGFKVPVSQSLIAGVSLDLVIEDLVAWGAGAVILTPDGEPAYVYSPGDIISLYLYKTAKVPWTGSWAEEPNLEEYEAGGNVTIMTPNKEMFPPLVARCLDFYLRLYLDKNATFAGREPGILVIRLESHSRPEDSSELVLNVFAEDFPLPNGMTFDGFLEWIGYLLPRHLRLRLIGMSNNVLDLSDFKSLRDLYTAAGLEAVPAGE